MLFSDVQGNKNSIFIPRHQYKSGEESFILLLEKNIFFIKSQKSCLGGIMIANTSHLGSDELKLSKKLKKYIFEFCYLSLC